MKRKQVHNCSYLLSRPEVFAGFQASLAGAWAEADCLASESKIYCNTVHYFKVYYRSREALPDHGSQPAGYPVIRCVPGRPASRF
ncbi:MAG: hypothetical protein LBP22_13340 [Deltaproteobacteria bacterium]|nr:hypothetical protein [Deltaproteobacteria bacterium]